MLQSVAAQNVLSSTLLICLPLNLFPPFVDFPLSCIVIAVLKCLYISFTNFHALRLERLFFHAFYQWEIHVKYATV